ncbi:MAG: glycosyltransferase family 4 protein [Chloroflexi bacterium]|nr:glycosyltransferase family 4 protein [Chloroflexota bacterium]
MKRVCIIRQKPYPNKNQRRNAETLVRAGYEVDILCLKADGEKKRDTLNGVNIHRLPLGERRGGTFRYFFQYAAFFTLAFFKLTQLSLKKRYDVVEVDTMPDFLVFVTFLYKLFGGKVVLYMYENTPSLFMSGFGLSPNHIAYRLLRLIEKASAGFAHRVVVSDGPPYKKVLENHGIPSEKITVVLNVPDEAIFNQETVPVTEDGDYFRLVVVTTLVKRYGVQILVKAVPLLVKDIPNLKIDVVGEGEFRPVLEEMARDLGVERYLNFTGFVPLDNVPAHIARAHIGVAPMIDDVGAPNKLFEYFSLGKVSVASALPGLTAVFNDGGLLYFPPGNEKELAARILELYRDPQKRISMGAAALNFYRQYRWPVLKQKYLKVYEEVMA